jgi:hypothetical protein
MLNRFLYLDTVALDGYLSAIEDGLRTSSESEDRTETSAEGKVDIKVVGGGGARKSSAGSKVTTSDTAHARYRRLISALDADPEEYDWHDVFEVDTVLESVSTGALIKLDCELHIPDSIKMLTGGELAGMLNMMQELTPLARMMNFATEGLPDENQVAGMSKFASSLPTDSTVVVGEPDSDSWKVAGKLQGNYLTDSEIDGPAIIVGKVARKVRVGEWKSLLSLPGMALMPRAQRRKMEKDGPSESTKDYFIDGPAIMLDVLAIYR